MKKSALVFLLPLSAFLGLIIIFPAYALPVSTPASAAPSPESFLFEEIPTVTSASRTEESILQAPAAISVISSKDLEQWGIVNLPDAFRYVPGVDVSALTEQDFGVSARGFNERYSRRMLVLFDNMTVYFPLISSVNWSALSIIMEDIESVEVLRGTNDTLYGFNAVNGVINIKTKEPKDTHGTLGKYLYGSNSRNQFIGRFGDRLVLGDRDLDYRLSYSYDESGGYANKGSATIQDWRRLNTFMSRGKYTLSDRLSADLWFGADWGSSGRSTLALSSASFRSSDFFNFQEARINADISDTHKSYVQFYRWYSLRDPKFLENGIPTQDVMEAQYDVEWQDQFSLLEGKSQTTLGANWRLTESENINIKRLLPDNTVQNAQSTLFSFFVNEKYVLTEGEKWVHKLSAVFGVRGEKADIIPDVKWAPRVSLLWEPVENHVCRATYARGYHLPSVAEEYVTLFTPQDVPSSSFFSILGNRDTKAETVDSYELGYSTALLGGRLVLDADTYISNTNGRIILDNVTPSLLTFNNSQDALTYGIELSQKFKVNPWLTVFTDFTNQQLHDKNFSLYSVPVRGTSPRTKVNAGVNMQFTKESLPSMPYLDGLSLNLNMHTQTGYADYALGVATPLNIESYTRVDFRVAKKLFDDKVEVAFNIQNLSGQDHFESQYVQVPRIYYATVTFRDWPWEIWRNKNS